VDVWLDGSQLMITVVMVLAIVTMFRMLMMLFFV
jgi:hypothetical protein